MNQANKLAGDGYLTGCSSLDEFRQLAESLGKVTLESDIRISVHKAFASGADAVPPHGDGPDARYIALYCVQQQVPPIPITLINARSALKDLSPKCIRFLQKSRFRRGGQEFHILTVYKDSFCLYYAPWLVNDRKIVEQETFQEFVRFVSRMIREKSFETLWTPGEFVIFDNYRFLHARQTLVLDSPRHLVRLWLN